MKTNNRNWLFLFLIMGIILILVYGCPGSDEDNNTTSITDKDGNVYTSVTIGTQTWMVENLKTTKYNDNTSITLATDSYTWSNLCTTPIYCWYNDDIAYKTPYGALYTWYAVATGKLCPNGWHVPSEAELTTLVTYLGGTSVAGAKLRESGTAHWASPNTGATNASGFTALPGGFRLNTGLCEFFGQLGWFWMATPMPQHQDAASSYNVSTTDIVGLDYTDNRTGNSVRCLKD